MREETKMPNIRTGYIVAAVLVVVIIGFMYYQRREKTAEAPAEVVVVQVEPAAVAAAAPVAETTEEKAVSVKDQDPTSPVDLGGPVGWTGPVSPQADPAAEGSDVYSFFPNKDSPAGNYDAYPDLAGKVMELKSKCNATKECRGFNTAGQLKSQVGDEASWTALEGEGAGLYVRHLTTTD